MIGNNRHFDVNELYRYVRLIVGIYEPLGSLWPTSGLYLVVSLAQATE
jgi:hypothetical protein